MIKHEFKINFKIQNKELNLFLKNISRSIMSKGYMRVRINEGIWNHTVYLTDMNFKFLQGGGIHISIDAYFQTRGELKLEQVAYRSELSRLCYNKFMQKLSVLNKFK